MLGLQSSAYMREKPKALDCVEDVVFRIGGFFWLVGQEINRENRGSADFSGW